MKKHGSIKQAIVLAALSLLFFACIAGFYIDRIRNSLITDLKHNVQEISASTTTAIEIRIHDHMSTLENISYMLQNEHTTDTEKLLQALMSASANSEFMRYGITDEKGNCLTTDGMLFYVGDREYFKEALKGKSSFSNTLHDKIGGYDLNVFATPVRAEDGSIRNVLFAASRTKDVADKLLMEIYDGKGFSSIWDEEGNIVLNSNSETASRAVHNLKQLSFYDDFGTEKLKKQESGIVKFKSMNNEDRYLAYEPLGYNNWYVFSVVPVSVVTSQINNVIVIAAATWFLVALVLSGIICYLYMSRVRNEKKIDKVVFYDDLTSHYNYNKFRMDVQMLLDKGQADSYALIEFDVSDFKLLNELYGYQGGDQLLITTMRLCEENCSADERCARISADRFIVLWKMRDTDSIASRYAALMEAVQEDMRKQREQFKADFYAGVYLLQNTDREFSPCHDRCMHAKMLGKAEKKQRCTFFSEKMYDTMLYQKRLEGQMEQALQHKEFKVFLQPKVTLRDDIVHSAEALVRWDSPIFGMIPPMAFIPLFEKNGFLEQLDMYMMDEVCQLLKKWEQTYPSLRISINVSRMYIFRTGFARRVLEIVERNGVSTKQLEIEITESVIFDRSMELFAIIQELRSYGFRISMDDFGSGYSSLNMLKDIPIDTIKLDQVFFQINHGNTQRARDIVGGVLSLAKTLGIHSVAEGIEEADEVVFLKEHGCDEIQGYYYSKPLCVEDFEAYICRQNADR